ncbi:hypothetical protein JI435_069070, partial [Parastagonospora nodorum SN15]
SHHTQLIPLLLSTKAFTSVPIQTPKHTYPGRAATPTMITDSQLYSLAIFLGSAAMLLIVLYHFLEVNSEEHAAAEKPKVAAGKARS